MNFDRVIFLILLSLAVFSVAALGYFYFIDENTKNAVFAGMCLVLFFLLAFKWRELCLHIKEKERKKQEKEQKLKEIDENPSYAEADFLLVPLDVLFVELFSIYHDDSYKALCYRYGKKIYLEGKIPDSTMENWLLSHKNEIVRFWVKDGYFSYFEAVPAQDRK